MIGANNRPLPDRLSNTSELCGYRETASDIPAGPAGRAQTVRGAGEVDAMPARCVVPLHQMRFAGAVYWGHTVHATFECPAKETAKATAAVGTSASGRPRPRALHTTVAANIGPQHAEKHWTTECKVPSPSLPHVYSETRLVLCTPTPTTTTTTTNTTTTSSPLTFNVVFEKTAWLLNGTTAWSGIYRLITRSPTLQLSPPWCSVG